MILNFMLDGQLYSEDLDVLAPLSHLLSDLRKDGFILNPSLLKLVSLDGVLVSSRHIPLMLINNSQILTKEGIMDSAPFKATQKALKEKALTFCPLCEASRFMLFYYLMQQKKRDHSSELWRFHQSQSCHCLSFSALYDCFLSAEKILHEDHL